MVVNDKKFYQKMKSKSLLRVEKNITKSEKVPYYNYNKLLFKKKDLKKYFDEE